MRWWQNWDKGCLLLLIVFLLSWALLILMLWRVFS